MDAPELHWRRVTKALSGHDCPPTRPPCPPNTSLQSNTSTVWRKLTQASPEEERGGQAQLDLRGVCLVISTRQRVNSAQSDSR